MSFTTVTVQYRRISLVPLGEATYCTIRNALGVILPLGRDLILYHVITIRSLTITFHDNALVPLTDLFTVIHSTVDEIAPFQRQFFRLLNDRPLLFYVNMAQLLYATELYMSCMWGNSDVLSIICRYNTTVALAQTHSCFPSGCLNTVPRINVSPI